MLSARRHSRDHSARRLLPRLACGVVAVSPSPRERSHWLRGGVASSASAQLINILRRAPFDGLAIGPQLAAQAEAALARARSGRPEDVREADKVLSTAWVTYVQAIKQPTRGMIYAYSVLKPQGTRADQILLTAAASPSLEAHVQNVSRVNAVYAQLRDAAWNQAQATGNLTPDPRLLMNPNGIAHPCGRPLVMAMSAHSAVDVR